MPDINKNYVKAFLLTIISIVGMFFWLLYLYDPLHIFRIESNKLSEYRQEICEDMVDNEVDCDDLRYLHMFRLQAAWFINNFDFDGVIMWSSMFWNTSSKEANTLLWWEFINLSFTSANLYERKMILEYALRKKNVKNVIISIDKNIIAHEKSFKKFPIENFEMLYDRNPFNDFTVYLNKKHIKCLLTRSYKTWCIWSLSEVDRPLSRYNKESHNRLYGWLKNWSRSNLLKYPIDFIESDLRDVQTYVPWKKHSEQKLKKVKNYLNTNIVQLIKNNPDTNFQIVMPPYSTLNYAIRAQKSNLEWKVYIEAIKYLVSQTKDTTNAKIYAFWLEPFTDNIWKYRDLVHYHHDYNTFITTSIAEGNNIVNEQNVNEYIEWMTDKAMKVNLQNILVQARSIVKRKNEAAKKAKENLN